MLRLLLCTYRVAACTVGTRVLLLMQDPAVRAGSVNLTEWKGGSTMILLLLTLILVFLRRRRTKLKLEIEL